MRRYAPITEEQMAVLNSFTCERLTADPLNAERIKKFTSDRGQGLVKNLQKHGWDSDRKGSIAYYVVKNPENKIVLFFSLKCGVLFDPNSVQNMLDYYVNSRIWPIWLAFMDGDQGAQRYMHRLHRQLGDRRYAELIDDLMLCTSIKRDKKKEPNIKIIRAPESLSAIELVEFCANDSTKKCWKSYGMPPNRRMGEVLFWWFIVPRMLEVSEIVGSEYAYLFAADETPDGELVQYYENAFHFRKLTHLGTIKPLYDMNCYFMGNRLRTIAPDLADENDYIYMNTDDGIGRDPRKDLLGLDHYRKEFFANFNPAIGGGILGGMDAV